MRVGGVGTSTGGGGKGFSALAAGEEVGDGATAGGAGQHVEEGRKMVWPGSRCCMEGLSEGGADVGGLVEELE